MAIELLTPFTKVELEPEIKEKKRKQVGILGGNFNPVHNAHLIVADQVRQQLGLDQVLLMPEWFSLWEFSAHATRLGLLTQLSGWMCLSWISRPAWCVTSLPKVGNPTFSCLSLC